MVHLEKMCLVFYVPTGKLQFFLTLIRQFCSLFSSKDEYLRSLSPYYWYLVKRVVALYVLCLLKVPLFRSI